MRFPRRSAVPDTILDSALAEAVGEDALEQLDHLATRVTISTDRDVMVQETVGREFLVVIDGEVEVERDGATVARLGPGDIVGEGAMLRIGRRNATVRADAGASVYALNRREFHSLMDASESFADHVRRTDLERRAG